MSKLLSIRSISVFVFLMACSGMFSYAGQVGGSLSSSVQLNLSGEIIALASCAGGEVLIAASKSGGATDLYRIEQQRQEPFTKQLVGNPARVATPDPRALAVSSDCSTAYLADATANKVFVVSLSGGQVRAEIVVGKKPVALARATHNYDLYAVNSDDGTLSVINSRTDEIKATVKVGTQPNAIALYSLGAHNRAFVTNTGSNTISIIDLNDDPANVNRYAIIATAQTGPAPIAIATTVGSWLGDMYAYFINSGDDTIGRLMVTPPHLVDSTVSMGDTPRAIFMDSARFCAYTVNAGIRSGQSAVAVAVAQFIGSPNPAVPVGQNPFHGVTPYMVNEKLSSVALFVPLKIQERIPGNPELVSRIQRQLWAANMAKSGELNLYIVDGTCPQLRGDEP